MNRTSYSILSVIALLSVVCVLCIAITGAGVYFYSQKVETLVTSQPTLTRPLGETPIPRPTLDSGAAQTEITLSSADVPIADRRDLADRLSSVHNIPDTLPAPSSPLQIGNQQSFYALNTDTNTKFKVQATLRSITPHLYFWVEEGVSFNGTDLKKLADTFENQIYPIDHEFFGSEWSPGVDNDVHLYILYARGLGNSVAGYYYSTDEYLPQVRKFSNAHEIFFLNADRQALSTEYTYSVLAHEFQHMIHWYRDRNEEIWMNEGFSVLAEFLNHYKIGGFDYSFAADPDIQLTDWPVDHTDTGPHYGASFLFLTYFLDRFGEDVTKAVAGEETNGLASIDKVLSQKNIIDPLTRKIIQADDIFSDWVVTNFVHDPSVADGRFVYHNYPDAPKVNFTESMDHCPIDPQNRDVSQYGADYIRFTCPGRYQIEFSGSTTVNVFAEKPHSGSFAYWSNKGDESDMTLTHSFDFTNQMGPITLAYWIWYDIEKDYDFVYLEAKENGGNWQILKTPSGTDRNISGNSYGWAYNGASSGWIEEKLDLSQFAGKKVDLRFEYVTDDATTGEGFLLDDISIPEIGYQTNFESDGGGWDAKGFVRIENQLPQKFRLELISYGEKTTVQSIDLSNDQSAEIPIQINEKTKSVVLVVSGATRFTRQLARYQFSVAQR